MTPDAEVVIGKYLRDVTGERLGGTTPTNRDDGWTRLTLLDDAPVPGNRDHLTTAYIQLDTYAGKSNSRSDASARARALRNALDSIAGATHEGAVVTGRRIASFRRDPDEDFEPARERYILVSRVFLHAL